MNTNRYTLSENTWTIIGEYVSKEVRIICEAPESVLLSINDEEPAPASQDFFPMSVEQRFYLNEPSRIWAKLREGSAPMSVVVVA